MHRRHVRRIPLPYHFLILQKLIIIVESRAAIRQQLRQRRRQLSRQQRRHAMQKISGHILRSAEFQYSQRIAGFLSNEGEPDLTSVMASARKYKKHWFLPIIGRPNLNKLWFAEYQQGDALLPNRFGINEPLIRLCDTPPVWGLDMVLMPLVAFDQQGNRLGMGKGYYDRSLQHLHLRKHWRKPLLVGVAYDFQRFDTLPFQPWDVPLDAYVTERGFFRINRGRE